MLSKIQNGIIGVLLWLCASALYANQIAWYVTFSGESSTPINNIYALSVSNGTVSGSVIAPSVATTLSELRTMAIGPDGKLYVVNSHKTDSRILKFDTINSDGITRNFIGNVVIPSTSSALVHPYQIVFSPQGDMFVSNQDTNTVLRVFGPLNPQSGAAMPISPFLSQTFPSGSFSPGTFVPAFSSSITGIPITPVPQSQGGLTTTGSSSVRGLAFAPNHTLYVSDEGNNRVMVFDTDTGQLINTISSSDTIQPDQVFFHLTDGQIYIACPGKHRIMVYNPKTQQLTTFIDDSTHLSSVSGIAFGEDGNFYAASRSDMVIYRYNSQGSFLGTFAGPFTDSPEGLVPLYSTYPAQATSLP